MTMRKCSYENLLKIIKSKPCLSSDFLQINAVPDNFPFTKKVLENKFEPRRHELVLDYLFRQGQHSAKYKNVLPVCDKEELIRLISPDNDIIEIYTNLDFYYIIRFSEDSSYLTIICEIK